MDTTISYSRTVLDCSTVTSYKHRNSPPRTTGVQYRHVPLHLVRHNRYRFTERTTQISPTTHTFGLSSAPRFVLESGKAKENHLFLHSLSEDGRAGRCGLRIKREEYGNCPEPRWPLVNRHHRSARKSTSTTTGLNGRKRSSSQKLALLPSRAVEPWEALEVDLLRIGTTSLAGNECILPAVDKASKFPFAFPTPSKRAEGVTRHIVYLIDF